MTPHEEAIPLEARLEHLIQGEGSDIFWAPEPATDEQVDAQCELSAALRKYERAFGLENTIQQLNLLRATATMIARKNAAQRRQIEARAAINAAAAEARAAGDEELARGFEAQPTPDYPEKDADERELANVG